ncbi:MAG: hypothetical protein IPM64_00970 [Phycisphaerales bacterium]|nr:hypothetical protein [Phycisphaerales bacterium]
MVSQVAPDRVISYALFGSEPFYRRHLPALVRAHLTLFPDWQLRIMHDDALDAGDYGAALRAMHEEGLLRLERVTGEQPPLTLGMLWRMKPCWEPGVRFNLCRDVDSLPTPRERRAVETFIRSGAAVHCINDHPLHTSAMMGGLIGFRTTEFVRVSGLTCFDDLVALGGGARAGQWCVKGYDQTVLCEHVWPRVCSAACVHRLRTPRSWPASEPVAAMHRVIDPGVETPADRELSRKADRLAPFIGADGYDVEPAVTFYSEVIAPELLERIRACESPVRQRAARSA